MKKYTFKYWIDKLGLEQHEEGGFFRETYRHKTVFQGRNLATNIYYLLPSGIFSKFHKLKNDEIWYFHYGSPMKLYFLDPDKGVEEHILGPDPEKGETFSLLVPGNTIFGGKVAEPDSYSLVSCNMTPGFEYEDSEMYTKKQLLKEFPEHAELINSLL